MTGLGDDLAGEELRRFDTMRSYRTNFDRVWSIISQLMLPRADDFISKRAPGQRREDQIFDSTAQLALPAFASAMESMLTPRTQRWHGLQPLDPELADDRDVQAYCAHVTDLLFRMRYAPRANFASQAYENYMSLGAFGTGAIFVEDGMASGIRYRHIPLHEIFIQEDGQGVVDTVYRKYELTARQAGMRWGPALPENVAKYADREPDRRFEFLHVVRPRTEIKRGDRTWKGMPIASLDISIEGKTVMREGGYRSMPYAVSRYVTAPREVYGRSPAWDALADVRTLNEMSKTALRYGQLVTDPMILTADLDGLSPFAARPGAINAGYLSDQGMELAKAFAPQGDPRFGLELQDQRRQSINRAFLVTLFQILVETPEMTATEAMLRAQEKGALLAPTVGRQQSEFLGVMITRELEIMKNAGVLPPPPPQLAARGGLVDIVYDSPLTRTQRAEEGVGIMRTLEAAGQLAQFDPSIMQEISAKRTLRRLGLINGAPFDMFATDEERAQSQQAQTEQTQLQNLAQVAPAVGTTVKQLAEAASATQQKAQF